MVRRDLATAAPLVVLSALTYSGGDEVDLCGRERAIAFRHEAAHAELGAIELADEDARGGVPRNEYIATRCRGVEQALERVARAEIETRCASAGAAAGPAISVVTTARRTVRAEDRLDVVGERDG